MNAAIDPALTPAGTVFKWVSSNVGMPQGNPVGMTRRYYPAPNLLHSLHKPCVSLADLVRPLYTWLCEWGLLGRLYLVTFDYGKFDQYTNIGRRCSHIHRARDVHNIWCRYVDNSCTNRYPVWLLLKVQTALYKLVAVYGDELTTSINGRTPAFGEAKEHASLLKSMLDFSGWAVLRHETTATNSCLTEPRTQHTPPIAILRKQCPNLRWRMLCLSCCWCVSLYSLCCSTFIRKRSR